MKSSPTIDDHKAAIGDQALRIICEDLGMRPDADKFSCPMPDHPDTNPSATWLRDGHKFKCWSRGCLYDIVDHLKIHCHLEGQDLMAALSELSGLSSTPVKRPKQKQETPPNISYEAKAFLRGRGILNEAIKAFRVTSSFEEVFFNCWDVIDGKWQVSCVKKRKCDKSMYGDRKEIYVPGGRTTFFGLPQITEKTTTAWITEGLLDAMQLYQAIHKHDPQFLVENAILSVPGGSNSFKSTWNNCEFIRRVPNFVVIPDADDAGLKMLSDVSSIITERLRWVDVSKLTGMAYTENHGDDVGEFLDQSPDSYTEILNSATEPPVEGLCTLDGLEATKVARFLDSGFLTHDQNDTGLKAGRLTILTGARGQGKTTVARQIGMAVVKQGQRVFCYFGESTLSEEKGRFARLCAQEGEIRHTLNEYGIDKYHPSDAAVQRFVDNFQRNLFFFDADTIEAGEELFPIFLLAMKRAASKGCKLFIIDSMMMLLSGNKDTFVQQREIVKGLKEFAKETQTHVLLIAHPKKGKGMQSISGALEQENMADTIIHYRRSGVPPNAVTDLPEDAKVQVSAVLFSKKVRDEGDGANIYLAWDAIRGAVVELSHHLKAVEYQKMGYWTHYVSAMNVFGAPTKLIEGENQ